jgi:UDP:flavonoid glycosyltransferase YjiC (YdhE family)
MKGLAAGVPLVCMPMGRDQNDAAARVVYRGAGIRIKPTASPSAIRAAVKEVLGDGKYKAAAGELQRAIADGTGCVDIVAELEAIAGAAASASHGTVAP